MIKSEIKFIVSDREYTVKYPTVGQFYQIESLKQSLSRGFYNTMVMSPSKLAQHALDMIDIEAALVVLCPSVIDDLKVKNFSELDVRDYKIVRDSYYKMIAPFFKEISDLLKGEEANEVKE